MGQPKKCRRLILALPSPDRVIQATTNRGKADFREKVLPVTFDSILGSQRTWTITRFPGVSFHTNPGGSPPHSISIPRRMLILGF
jgi:hypothetical protein